MGIAGRLGADRLDYARVSVSERVHGEAGEHVQVALPVSREQVHPFPPLHFERKALVRMEESGGFPVLHCPGLHGHGGSRRKKIVKKVLA